MEARKRENVKPTLEALQQLLGLSDAELKKMVLKTPPMLRLSFEKNVRPSLDSLQELQHALDAPTSAKNSLAPGYSSGAVKTARDLHPSSRKSSLEKPSTGPRKLANPTRKESEDARVPTSDRPRIPHGSAHPHNATSSL